MNKKGVLLINLGTPENNTPLAVFRYLREFLNDPRVIDLPGLVRWLLVNLIIIPCRYKKTTKAYQKIWTEKGSPLLVNSLEFTKALAMELGEEFQVELGMRYGSPSIQEALIQLKSCNSIRVMPLFPQYSSAATGSAIERVKNVLQSIVVPQNIPRLFIQKDFYNHLGFIAATTDIIKKNLDLKKVDKLIFSYHGLPEGHLPKNQCAENCNKIDICPPVEKNNLYCYRAQCFATSRSVAQALTLESSQYIVSFQSRLGKTPWIQPYTDVVLQEFIQKGIKNIAVVCPSFVADCLETLEEVNIRFRAKWEALGGGEFIFIPCVNVHPLWVKGLAESIRDKA